MTGLDPSGTPGCTCNGLRQALADAAAKGREIARLDDVVEDLQSSMTGLDPIDGVPMVRVLDGDGAYLFSGWYVRHVHRLPCELDDELRPDDVYHLVLHDEDVDWNLPRKLIATKVTSPHTIEVVER